MLIPTQNRIVLRQAEAVRQSAGGIHLPDQAVEPPLEGTIMAVGPTVPEDITVGSRVIFAGWAGMPIEYLGTVYILLTADDILCSYPASSAANASPASFEEWKKLERKAAGLPG